MTTDEFITRAISVHGDRFDYASTVYVNSRTPVSIRCKEHGDFTQVPSHHLEGHSGCKFCHSQVHKTSVYGIGENDLPFEGKAEPYIKWRNLLKRCYDPVYLSKEPSYAGCSVCDEWLTYSHFKKWFEANNIPGYALDKDILVRNNKVYSPQTCCFVPQEINNAVICTQQKKSELPSGIAFQQWGSYYNYKAQMSKCGKLVCLGHFSTPEEAHLAYKEAKEQYVKELAIKYYKDKKISKKVYLALLEYTVD